MTLRGNALDTGQRIAIARGHVFTQAEIGKAIGVSQSTVATWETGKRQPQDLALQRLAEFFDCDPEWFRYGRGRPPKRLCMEEEEKVDNGLAARIRQLIALYETRLAAAGVAQVSIDMLSAYEAGTFTPRFDTLARLALAKGVSLTWLATGLGEMVIQGRPDVLPANMSTTDIIRETIEAVMDLGARMEKALPASYLGAVTADIVGRLLLTYEDPEHRKIGLKLLVGNLRPDIAAL